MEFGVAAVHAEEIAREQRRLVAPGPGADFQDGAALIGGIARQQRQPKLLCQVLESSRKGLALLFGAYGFIADDSRALRTASQTVEVILACGAVVQFLKHTTGRESPFCATTPTGRWALFPNQIEYAKHVPHYDAFPSGHIATALATLTVIADNYDDQKWIRYIGYPVIGAVGIGLVATSIHWWSDIPLGLALGYSFGRIVSGHGRPDAGMARLGTGSVPDLGVTLFSDGTPGIQASWRW